MLSLSFSAASPHRLKPSTSRYAAAESDLKAVCANWNYSIVAARLREAGAIFIGKTNLHEFAFGTTNEDSAYGAVRHPLDPTRSPGGSSGGGMNHEAAMPIALPA